MEYRDRDNAARRDRYARQKAEGRVPADLLKNHRRLARLRAEREAEGVRRG
ncbi:hypothetical protein [Microbacterium sp. HJ5]